MTFQKEEVEVEEVVEEDENNNMIVGAQSTNEYPSSTTTIPPSSRNSRNQKGIYHKSLHIFSSTVLKMSAEGRLDKSRLSSLINAWEVYHKKHGLDFAIGRMATLAHLLALQPNHGCNDEDGGDHGTTDGDALHPYKPQQQSSSLQNVQPSGGNPTIHNNRSVDGGVSYHLARVSKYRASYAYSHFLTLLPPLPPISLPLPL